jgi:sugar phosphate isomerase/epimerase
VTPRLSVFTVMLPDLTPEEAVGEIAAAGYEGVEWRVTTVPAAVRDHPPSFWGNNRCTLEPTLADARRAGHLAEAHGLVVSNLGAYPPPGELDVVEAVVRFAEVCGASQVRVMPFSMSGGTYAEALEASRRYLELVEGVARRSGVRALIEIHHQTIVPSASLARRLVDGFDPEFVGVIHDAGNMAFEGFEDYRIGLEVLGPYLAHVHVKNTKFGQPDATGTSRPWFSPFDDGVVDFDALFTALRDVGYDGWISVEDFGYTGSSREALRDDAAFVRAAVERRY